MFDIVHAVLPTRLPLEEFYAEYSGLWRHVLDLRYRLQMPDGAIIQLDNNRRTGEILRPVIGSE